MCRCASHVVQVCVSLCIIVHLTVFIWDTTPRGSRNDSDFNFVYGSCLRHLKHAGCKYRHRNFLQPYSFLKAKDV